MDISERVSALLTALNMTPYQLAKELNYKAPEKIYTIINRKSKPGFDTLTDILTRFDQLSSEWLMRGEGEMFRKSTAHGSTISQPSAHTPAIDQAVATIGESELPDTINVGQNYLQGKTIRPLAVTVDRMGQDTILLVPIRAQAGYRQRYFDVEYIKELSAFTLPNFNTGTYRAFEVEGDSMQPTIRHADFVICSYLENWEYVRPRHVYVIVTPEYVLVKRIVGDLREKSLVELQSDNSYYPPQRLPVEAIKEIWQVRGILTTQIPANLYEVQEKMVTMIETLGRNATDTQGLVKELIAKLTLRELA